MKSQGKLRLTEVRKNGYCKFKKLTAVKSNKNKTHTWCRVLRKYHSLSAYASKGSQVQIKFLSPYVLFTLATAGQNLLDRV